MRERTQRGGNGQILGYSLLVLNRVVQEFSAHRQESEHSLRTWLEVFKSKSHAFLSPLRLVSGKGVSLT